GAAALAGAAVHRADEERSIRDAAERDAMARLEESERGAAESGSLAGEERARAEAERRIREAEERQRKAEQRDSAAAEEPVREPAAGIGPLEGVGAPSAGVEEGGAQGERSMPELPAREAEPAGGPVQRAALASELHETEARLADAQRRTDEALERAAQRLKEVEARASAAEARAARADRLAQLKTAETDREHRLRELL